MDTLKSLKRVGQVRLRVGFGELHIMHNDPVWEFGTARILVNCLEGNWTKERAGLHGSALFPVDNRVESIPLAVNRDDDHIFTWMPACCLEGSNRANRHLVIVSVDSGHVRGSLQEGRQHFATGVAVEVAILGSKEYHARSSLDLVVKAFLTIDSRRSAGGSFQLDDLGFAAGSLDQPVSYALTLLNEVGTDEGHIILVGLGECVIYIAVDQDNMNTGSLGLELCGYKSFLGVRGEPDNINLLQDH